MKRTDEVSFETIIEHHLLGNGYATVDRDGFDRERVARHPAPWAVGLKS